MSKLSEEKREVLASIDAILTMIEKYPSLNLSGFIDNISLGVSVNPWDFLLDIIAKKVTDEEMMEWLVNMMTTMLPALELGVKGVLLTNLKGLIDCNLDPRIPYWMRKEHDTYFDNLVEGQVKDNGFIFNLKSIDYTNMLSYSPLSPIGQQKYFGTKSYYTYNKGELKDKKYYSYKEAVQALEELQKNNESVELSVKDIIHHGEIDTIYELARANDFNAFLWFVKRKANFINAMDNPFADTYNILKPFTTSITISDDIVKGVSVGTVLKQKINDTKYASMLSLCTKCTTSEISDNANFTDDNGYVDVLTENACMAAIPKESVYQFVPVSSNKNSANWYVNSGTYFNFLKEEKNRVARDYGKDYAICNIENITTDEAVAASKEQGIPIIPNGEYVRFTILPAPFLHIPTIGMDDGHLTIEAPWKFKRILFDADGKPSSDGKYSVDAIYTSKTVNDGICTYSINNSDAVLNVNTKTGEYSLSNKDFSDFYECYNGLTVYDFNYHFVMGMQLFDPTVIASNLMELVTNIRQNNVGSINIGVGVDKTESAYQIRIAEIIKNIIESSGYESSDCFYSFSNDKFNSMLEKAELKRSQGYAFENATSNIATVNIDEAYDILNEFDDNATLNANKDVLTRAIIKATASITDEALPEDAYNLKLTIIQELIKSFTLNIVQTILTPKIILLFEVNKRMLGSDGTILSLDEFLESISTLLVSIVRQVADMILRELLRWAQSIVLELIHALAALLITEKVEYYTRLMAKLIKACSFRIKRSQPLDTMLDNVDYADIDETAQPQTNEC